MLCRRAQISVKTFVSASVQPASLLAVNANGEQARRLHAV
jgi:hypothetical protein